MTSSSACRPANGRRSDSRQGRSFVRAAWITARDRLIVGVEDADLVAVGVAEIGAVEGRQALAGRAVADAARCDSRGVNGIDLLLGGGGQAEHAAVAGGCRLPIGRAHRINFR